jgi:p-aminobenzoyl-glutamate transporter AbgT
VHPAAAATVVLAPVSAWWFAAMRRGDLAAAVAAIRLGRAALLALAAAFALPACLQLADAMQGAAAAINSLVGIGTLEILRNEIKRELRRRRPVLC